LTDDGSTDGTSEAVGARFPQVKILTGDGNLYWNGGMRVAFAEAMKGGFDYYLWLNDDTTLHRNALAHLLAAYQSATAFYDKNAIIVGSTCDSGTNEVSYGGWNSVSRVKRSKFKRVLPDVNGLMECDSMNGNCVLIPGCVAERVGNLDPVFTHSMGDIDYGLRARMMGVRNWVAPGFVGVCESNAGKGLWVDKSLSYGERWKKLLGPKGLPLHEWYIFTRRHAGVIWPLVWASPYFKLLVSPLMVIYTHRIPSPNCPSDDKGGT
jgi:GT2 family glycosyltransferase